MSEQLPHGVFDHCEHPLCDDWLGCCRCIRDEQATTARLRKALGDLVDARDEVPFISYTGRERFDRAIDAARELLEELDD